MAYRIARTSRTKFFLLVLTLLSLLSVLTVVSLSVGSSAIPPAEALRCLMGAECDEPIRLVLRLRVTRTTASILVGCVLAVAGVLIQGITRNPLADPFILGISSTALATLSIALLIDVSILAQRQLAISIALGGALLGYFLTTSIGVLAGGTGLSLVLSGVAVSALFSGVSHVLLYILQDRLRHPYANLLMGSTSGILERDILYLAVPAVISLLSLYALGVPKALNAYLFGEHYASQLGYRVKLTMVTSAFIASLLTGASVAVVGIVGFIGLAGPHISRMLYGTSDHRVIIVLSALAGSVLAVSADILARLITLFSTRGELPLGVITSIIGAPFLAYLVIKGGRR
ncbi:MAG: iron ABC transporter permease [Sulfolobales archaeon]